MIEFSETESWNFSRDEAWGGTSREKLGAAAEAAEPRPLDNTVGQITGSQTDDDGGGEGSGS